MSRIRGDHDRERGVGLLLVHCGALGGFDQARLPVAERLRELVGPDLARLLLAALSGDHRMGSRGLAT